MMRKESIQNNVENMPYYYGLTSNKSPLIATLILNQNKKKRNLWMRVKKNCKLRVQESRLTEE